LLKAIFRTREGDMYLISRLNSYRRFILWVFSRLRRREWFNIVLLYNSFYLLVILVSFYSTSRIHQIGGQPIINAPRLFAGLFKWDSINYLHIATSDYTKYSSLSAFMPLYPYLSYHISNFLHISIQTSMMLVSYSAGLASLGLIYLLSNRFFSWIIDHKANIITGPKSQDLQPSSDKDIVARDNTDYKKYSLLAILAFLAFPTSFALIIPYADSLFISLTLATILLALKKKWFLSAVFASLSVLTKPIGIIIIVFLIVEYFSSIRFNLKKINKNLAFTTFPIMAFGIYLYWANHKFGNAMSFYDAQYHINRYFSPNLNFIWVWGRELLLLIELAFKQKYIETFLNEAGYLVSWTAAFYAVIRLTRLRLIPLGLSIYFMILSLSMIYGGNFVSVNRYVLIIIPLFWWIVLRFKDLTASVYFILALSLCFLIMNIVLFSNGFWVF
jgi:hypothetical protein